MNHSFSIPRLPCPGQFQHWLACLIAATSLLAAASHASEPAPDKSTARYEIMFMEDMIPHHLSAAKMAALCQPRVTHPELLEMCKSIETTQKDEVQQMKSWLRDWYGEGHEPELFEQQEMDLEHMASLSGAAFEQAFLTMMIPHHMIAIQESAECQVQGFHGQLRHMCREIVKAQADEIHQMRDWLCQWHGTCDLELRRSAMTGKPGQMAHGTGAGAMQSLNQLRDHPGR
ncbi:MAG: DUF305 domain-containing protein [Pseudomonadota bacterium]